MKCGDVIMMICLSTCVEYSGVGTVAIQCRIMYAVTGDQLPNRLPAVVTLTLVWARVCAILVDSRVCLVTH